MLKILFLLFVTVPLIELYVLIEVGGEIGGAATILLCLFTAALGGLLIRLEGLSTLIDAQRRLAMGEFPAEHGIHGLLLAVAGVLLFTPGFITDAIGFVLLIPPVRNLIIERLLPFSSAGRARTHGRDGDDIIDIDIIPPSDDRYIR